MFRFLFLALGPSFLILAGCVSAPKKDACLEKRGALDIGSGSTKAVVALVNTCEKRIVRLLFDEQVPVAFSEAAERSADHRIPTAFVDEALPRMKALAAKMKSHEPVSVSGVATSTFRTAPNGVTTAQRLAKEIGLPIEVISQEEEAKLGYWSAVAKRGGNTSDDLVVWDIGGGSMQMIRFENGEARIYEGKLAAVAFKNRVLREIQHKDPRKNVSPNPLGTSWEKALKMSKEHAARHVPDDFKEKSKGAVWVGIGGVLARSIREQVGEKESYTFEDIRRSLEERSSWNDEQVGGPYSVTDVTNLALVGGYFEALGLEKLETVSASLGQGRILAQLQSRAPARQAPQAQEIPPAVTGRGITQARGPHLARMPAVFLNSPKLLITLGGTGSFPKDYGPFAELASQRGFHVLSVDYPNQMVSTVCRDFPHPECFDRFREEIVFGGDRSPHVAVDEPNSIVSRIRALVFWLQKRDPSWKDFWTGSDVDWSKVVVAGHSQGSGHAAYLSKRFPLKGVLLFAGPQDSLNGEMAAWIFRPGATAGNRYAALLHKDDFFGSEGQIRAWKALRLAARPPAPDSGGGTLIVSEKKVEDPHTSVVFPYYASEWSLLLQEAAR